MMPTGGRKEGESSGDESKKRATSPATDNNDSDSVDGGRRSRRKKTKLSSVCITQRASTDAGVKHLDVRICIINTV